MDPYSNIRLPPNITLELVDNNAAASPSPQPLVESSPSQRASSSAILREPSIRSNEETSCMNTCLREYTNEMSDDGGGDGLTPHSTTSSDKKAILDYLGLDKKTLLDTQTKDLNRLFKIKNVSPEVIVEMKQYRRTLKNRIYALKSRESRQFDEKDIKEKIQALEEEKRRVLRDQEEMEEKKRLLDFYCRDIKKMLASLSSEEEIKEIIETIIRNMKDNDTEHEFGEDIYDMLRQL